MTTCINRRKAIESNRGYEFKTVCDAFCATFVTAVGLLKAAIAAQLALKAEKWDLPSPLSVRMSIHT